MPFTQNDVKQCWANAYASRDVYRVPVASLKEAIALRAQCHRLRKKEADALYPTRPDDYFLYELEIVLEDKCVIFQRKRKLNLPPPVGAEAPHVGFEVWAVMERAGVRTVERHKLPTTDPDYKSGHSTEAEARAAL